ncbi:MAG: hypothetical protein WD825_04285 [Gemmatimonadaceae bacterium]
MPYTLWHLDKLVGETGFEHAGPAPGQRLGMLRPTPYGYEVVPQMCGFLAASFALKKEMERRGFVSDDQADGMLGVLEHSAEGNRVVGIVKHLAELELRAPDGDRQTINSIAVTDLRELAALVKDIGSEPEFENQAMEEDGRPRYLISATFEVAGSSAPAAQRSFVRLKPRWRH